VGLITLSAIVSFCQQFA